MTDEVVTLKRNLPELRKNEFELFMKNLDDSNKIWQSIIRLIITLSSSFLVLTIALVEKLFPSVNGVLVLPFFLIVSWILLFVAVIFGIFSEIHEVVFYSNRAIERGNNIKKINAKISRGEQEEIYTEDENTPYVKYRDIVYPAVSIDSFLMALISMCAALLIKVTSLRMSVLAFFIAVIVLIVVNVKLIKERKVC